VLPNDVVESLSRAARSAIKDPGRITTVRADVKDHPRFELFHAAISFCSQKVRAVLAEKGVSYISNDMDILTLKSPTGEVISAENYHPDYVRLRLHGGESLARPLVSAYTGTTSVETEGFDACVVPLLVDHEKGRVVVDSFRICTYIDDQIPGPTRLMPRDPTSSQRVAAQVEIVDRMPNGRYLYGFHPDDDRRPEALKQVMADIYDHKIVALENHIRDNSQDSGLVAAYRSKIAKEAGGKAVQHDADFQRQGRARAVSALSDLHRQLRSHGDQWVCGPDFTLADVLWGTQLFRFHYLGLESLWSDLPALTGYTERLYSRPSIRREVIAASLANFPPSMYTSGMERIVHAA